METDTTLKLLSEYDWIYNFKVTQFFCGKHWECIPKEWEDCLLSLSNEELNELPFGYMKGDWPCSLKTFLRQALSSSHDRNLIGLPDVHIKASLRRGMSPKKQHEVSKMAAFVHLACERSRCDIIVDVGSGLGYLGQVLQLAYGHKILGLESRESHTSGAKRRGEANAAIDDIKNMTFELEDTEDCLNRFQMLLRDVWIEFKSDAKKSEQIPSSQFDVIQNEDSSNESNIEKELHKDTEEKNVVNPCSSGLRKDTARSEEFAASVDYCGKESIVCGLSSIPYLNTDVEQTGVTIKLDKQSETSTSDVIKETNLKSEFNGDITNVPHNSNVPRVCLIGLHCCGDLTPTMMVFFTKLDCVKVLCCVSCCYHRMKFDEKEKKIRNFPMSKQVKALLGRVCGAGHWSMTGYGLRLAAQETRSRWRQQNDGDHQFHVRNVAYRGLLELYLKSESVHSEKLVRKLTKKADTETFPKYIKTVLQNLKMQTETAAVLDREHVTDRLLQLYDENSDIFKYIEPFTALQVVLQPVLESLLYRDRQYFLIEQGFKADVIPIFDESISPRNLALIAFKDGVT